MSLVLSLVMFVLLFAGILAGFPVMFVLLAAAFLVAGLGILPGTFDMSLFGAIGPRLIGIIENQVLYAIPLFILLGKLLENSKMTENLFAWVLRRGMGGRGTMLLVMLFSVVLAASSGLVGASILLLASIAFPALKNSGLSDRISGGLVCAAGTLGQMIPPSIVLILLADQISNAYQSVQLAKGNFAPDPVTIGHMFAGAVVPGLLLALFYGVYGFMAAGSNRARAANYQQHEDGENSPWLGLVGLAALLAVPVSIVAGIASPTEAAAIGVAVVATVVAMGGSGIGPLQRAVAQSLELVGTVFGIIFGATVFALVFRGIGGDLLVAELLPDGRNGQFLALAGVLTLIFILGFVLEFIEITYLVVPITAPMLLSSGVDPIWLAVLVAIVLQTSFLTPPMGVSLFYFKSVSDMPMTEIYRSVVPFVMMQLGTLIVLLAYPQLATWLPNLLLQ